jgi:ketosteroid isomerase-like protein
MAQRTMLVLSLAFALTACTAPMLEESPEIAARSDLWEQAFNAGDVEGLVDLYTEDARVMPPNAESGTGHAAVETIFGGMIEAGLTGKLETIETVASGDLGHRVGAYTVLSSEGEEIDRGKFVETWQRVAGEWKMTADIWNSDLPAAEAGTSLLITHEVEDAERWLAAWEGPERRELFAQHGAPSVAVLRNPEAPTRTALLVEVTDMEAFQAFLASEEGQSAAAEDGVLIDTLTVYSE